MGLDNFVSGGSVTESKSTANQSDNSTGDDESIEEAYKVFSADDGRKKVFKTEEDWDKAVSFIENELGMSEEQVVNMESTQRHDILHQAIMGEEGVLSGDFYPTRYCLVCDQAFSFPTNWNFTRFEGEAVCDDHTVKEVIESYRKMNELHG